MRPHHLLAIVLAFAGSARAAGDLNVVTAVEVKDEGPSVVLRIAGSKAPSFTTFSMADPPRFVIDLSEARFQGVPEDLVVRDGVVNLVKNLSYGSDATSIARIMVAFQLEVDPPEVQAEGSTLLVRVAKPAGASAAVSAADGASAREAEEARARAEAQAEADRQAQAEAERVAQEEAAARAGAEAQARTEAQAQAEAQARAEAEAQAQAQAEAQARVTGADTAQAASTPEARDAEAAPVAAAEEAPSVEPEPSAEEARAAYERERQEAVARAQEEALARARAEAEARDAAEARARAERELAAANGAAPVGEAASTQEREPAGLDLPAGAAAEAAPAVAESPAVAQPQPDLLEVAAPTAQLRELGFRQLPGASRVYVRTSVTPRFTIQDVGENVIRVELENTRATRRNDLRHLDTSFFPSAVAVVTPARRGSSYVLDIKLRERVPYQQRLEGDMLAIDFERPAAAGALPVAASEDGGSGAEPIPAALEGEAPSAAPAAN